MDYWDKILEKARKKKGLARTRNYELFHFRRGSWNGESHPQHKLTNEKVREIRKLREQGEKVTNIAKKFQIHQTTVYNICNRKAWKHVK